MLEGVGIDFAILQRFVRLVVIIKHHRLNGQPFRRCLLHHFAPDIFVFAADDTDFDGCFICCMSSRQRSQNAAGNHDSGRRCQ